MISGVWRDATGLEMYQLYELATSQTLEYWFYARELLRLP